VSNFVDYTRDGETTFINADLVRRVHQLKDGGCDVYFDEADKVRLKISASEFVDFVKRQKGRSVWAAQ
jgi:hypothetical protein